MLFNYWISGFNLLYLFMNVNLKIKKANLEAIKSGIKKTEWREPSVYNKKLFFKPRESDGKNEGNADIKTITFVNPLLFV